MKFPFTVPSEREFDALGFGTNAVDYLITVPEFPRFASKVEFVGSMRAAGGEVASALVGLQRLGMKTAYAGSFGDDDEGVFGIRSLETEGVDTSRSRIIDAARTQIAFIVIDARSGERTIIWKRDERLAYKPDDQLLELVSQCRLLHMTPHDTGGCIELARAAREAGTPVSLDIDNNFERVDELLPLVDVLICSSELPAQLTGISDSRASLTALNERYGCAVVGMTLGETGSLLFTGGEFVATDGYDVPGGCKDTTGAGDAFRTGLLYGILNGESVEDSARIANAVAALKCRAVGARTALPGGDELKDLLSRER
jgi:sugar/nucleoside kinase (ribokinase family)